MQRNREVEEEQTDEDGIIYVNPHELRIFIRTVYLLTIIFSTLIVAQWIIYATMITWSDIVQGVGLVAIVIVVVVISVLNMWVSVRYIVPVNYILAAFVVEGTAIGVGSVTRSEEVLEVIYSVLIGAGVTLLLILLGVWVPTICLPGEICMCVIIFIFFVGLITVVTFIVLTNFLYYVHKFVIAWMVLLVPPVLYHVQVIHGRRFGIPIRDALLCALMLTLDYSMFCMGAYYLKYLDEKLIAEEQGNSQH